jgi:hypothetical protein
VYATSALLKRSARMPIGKYAPLPAALSTL